MGYQLVGSVGDVRYDATGHAITPSWGANENRLAGNLLVAWFFLYRFTATIDWPTTPTGWSVAATSYAEDNTYLSCGCRIYYRISQTDGEAAPTFTAPSSACIGARLAEFSGNAITSPLDEVSPNSGHHGYPGISPIYATAPLVDETNGELCIYAGYGGWAGSSSQSMSQDVNNCAENTTRYVPSYPAKQLVDLGYGITTANSSPTQNAMTVGDLPHNVLEATCIATFKAGVTYDDQPEMSLQISETISEIYDNKVYDDHPVMQLVISETINEVYSPPYYDYPAINLALSIGPISQDIDGGSASNPGMDPVDGGNASTVSWDFTYDGGNANTIWTPGTFEEIEYVDTVTMNLAISETISELQIAAHLLLVREIPPLDLSVNVKTRDGTVYRWAHDEVKAENQPKQLGYSSTAPGGDEQAQMVLPRLPEHEYRDLAKFSDISIRSAAGYIAWNGRLETSPQTSGDEFSITPGAVGYQAELDDNEAVRALYVHRSIQEWQEASVQRKILYLNSSVDVQGPSINPDPTSGYSALGISFTGPWSRSRVGEAWFDSKGIPLDSVYFAWTINDNIVAIKGLGGWGWGAGLCDDDIAEDMGASWDAVALSLDTSGSAVVSSSINTRQWAMVHVQCQSPNTNEEGKDYSIWFTCLAVYGDYGLTKRGTNTATEAQGFYASDIVAHAVQTWAPSLSLTTGTNGTVQPSDFIIPHASFLEATKVSEIIRDVTKYDLQDWFVYPLNGVPTFFWGPRNYFGKKWRARVGPSGLKSTGPQVDRMWNAVVVQYQSTDGRKYMVGPPGSDSDVEDSSLYDSDPLNPVTAAGKYRLTKLDMGIGTWTAAISIGQSFLVEQKLLSTAGEAEIVGIIPDDCGVIWPASYIKAGDRISFTDAAYTGYRRIVKASYNDDTKVMSITLDSPSEGLDAILARLNVVLIPIGV